MLQVRENVALAPLTTFEIGGEARHFVDVRTEDEMRKALLWAREKSIRPAVLGGGSNVLIPDEGLDALVIHIVSSEHSFDGDSLTADAGCNLLALIREAGKKSLGGWEKLAGIPGTIGGAVRGNAGAFGSEIKDFVVKVKALNAETGEIRDFSNAECDLSYRHSYFKDHPEWILTVVQARLAQGDNEGIRQSIEKTMAERERRHLQNVRAAGSYFMNPIAPKDIVEMFEREKQVKSRECRVPAGWLIEKAGMKGAMVGGAIASLQHPNYIVNQGGATAADVCALAEKIKEAVKIQFGIELREEAAVL